MPNFCANLSMLFNEVNFLERFERARAAGFTAVEFMSPYEWDKKVLAAKLEECHLKQVMFNLPAGNWTLGERGIACLPDRIAEFRQGMGTAIEYAKALNCTQVNCLAGIRPENQPAERIQRTLVENLRFAAAELQREGIRLLVEPVNDRDMPGFCITHTRDALGLFKLVSHENLWLQYDAYHMQVMEGNLADTIRNNLQRIAHIQVADNPGRHEPGTGEINYPFLFNFIDEIGYRGWVGCEYRPAGRTEDGLKWLRPYLGK
jgi:hydroxypyruvate isomerase